MLYYIFLKIVIQETMIGINYGILRINHYNGDTTLLNLFSNGGEKIKEIIDGLGYKDLDYLAQYIIRNRGILSKGYMSEFNREKMEDSLYRNRGAVNGRNSILRIGTYISGSNICGINLQEKDKKESIVYGTILRDGISAERLVNQRFPLYAGEIEEQIINHFNFVKNAELEARIKENNLNREEPIYY